MLLHLKKMKIVEVQYETSELIVKVVNLVKIANSAKRAELVKIVSYFILFFFGGENQIINL